MTGEDDEADLFRRLMSDATPLSGDSVPPPPRRSTPKAKFSRQDDRDVMRESLSGDSQTLELESGDSLSFARPSVSRSSLRKLSRGAYSVQSEIDLHGLTADEAKSALSEFLERSVDRGHRCVRVIHGKGLGSGRRGPVLKRKVDKWLRQWDWVLAFVSARTVDGGTGACYVLLKNRRRSP